MRKVLIAIALLAVISYEFSGTTREVLNGLLATIKENIWLILVLLFFALVSWVLKTIKLVTGNVPELRDTRDAPGTSDLLLVLFMVSGLVYVIIIYPLDWIVGDSVLNTYAPSLLAFSFLAAMTVFEWAELKDKTYISTGLEWIPLSVIAYPDEFFPVFLAFPVLLILGRFERPRNLMRKTAPALSALWLGVGFWLGVFPPEALLWLALMFAVYLFYQKAGNERLDSFQYY
jgi:hypothetical protein